MIIDKNPGMVLTASSFHDPGESRQYQMNVDGTNGGYQVLAAPNRGMSEMRFENGNIYFSDPDGIYVLSRFVIDGCDNRSPGSAASRGRIPLRED